MCVRYGLLKQFNIEKVQKRATKYILHLRFMTNVPYTSRLLQLNFPYPNHKYLDLVLLYKIINGYRYIDKRARPIVYAGCTCGITLSQTNKDVIKFSIPFTNTVETFPTSYFIRAFKT